ncbi:amidohydrolase [Streptomyces sp. NPDC056669]|uniref:amidohydrolase n=1 Tax=unclassified Streptomyces TaxID=2593676 RepID=UPI0036B78154
MAAAADLVVLGGQVLTVDENFTIASAVAVANGRIAAVGDDETIRPWIGPKTDVIELRGRTVLPGINDAHLHLALFGTSRPPFSLDLTVVDSLAALQQAFADAASEPPDNRWLTGHGWREATITEYAKGVAPHRAHLDKATGDHPALLEHASGHAVLVNSAALRLAGITAETPDPTGGQIVRDHAGEPTGMLLESAGLLATRHAPPLTQQQRLAAIASAMHTLNSLGITSVTDPIVWPELLRDYTALHRQDRMTIRVNTLLHWGWPSPTTSYERLKLALEYAGISTGLGDDWLRIGGCKLFADGVPTHCTAWLYEPYPGGGTGHLVTEGDDEAARYTELLNIIELVHQHRLQAQIHVTGDRAADAAIDGIVRAIKSDPWPDARHALIHGTLLAERSFPRLAAHGIGVITSSLMKSHSGASIAPAIGERRWANAFPAGALLAAGVHVADSSDAPVTFPDWRRGLATFVGAAPHPFAEVPSALRLTREQAIRLWTTGGAYMEHAEHRKGSISPGMLADLVVLDEDFLTVEDSALHELTPVLTIAGGRRVFDAMVV